MERPKTGHIVSKEADIRAVLRPNGPKKLTRLLGVPLETARRFYYRNLSASRAREVAAALLAEMDAQDRERDALRLRIRGWGNLDDATMASHSASSIRRGVRGAEDETAAPEMGQPARAT